MAEKGKGIWHYLALLAVLCFILFLGDNVAVAFRPPATFGWRQVAIHGAPLSRKSDLAGITISPNWKQSPHYLTNNSEMDSLPKKKGRDATDQQKNGKDNTEDVRPSVGSRKPLAIPHPVSARTIDEMSSSNACHNQAIGTADETANRLAATKTKSCEKEKDGEQGKEATNSKSSVGSSYIGTRASVIEAEVVRTNGNLKARNAPLQDGNIVDETSSPGLFNVTTGKATRSVPPRETSNKSVSTHEFAEVASVLLSAVSPSNRSSVAGHAANAVDEASKPVAGPTEKALKTTLPVSSPAEVGKAGENTSVRKSEEKQGNDQLASKNGHEVNKSNGTSVSGRIQDALPEKSDNIIASQSRVHLAVPSPPSSYPTTEGAEVTKVSNATASMEKDGASAFAVPKSKAAYKVVNVKDAHRDKLQPSYPTSHSTGSLKVDALTNQTIKSASSQTNTFDKTKSGESTSGSVVYASSSGSNPLVDDKLPSHTGKAAKSAPSGNIDGINRSKKADAATVVDLGSPIASHTSRATGTKSALNSSSDACPKFNSASIPTNMSKNPSALASNDTQSEDNTSASVPPQKLGTVAKGTGIPRSKSKRDDSDVETKDVNRPMQRNELRAKDGIDPVNKTLDEDAPFISRTPIDAANLHTAKMERDLPLSVTPVSSSNTEKTSQEERSMSASRSTTANPTDNQNNATPVVVEASTSEKSTLRSSSDEAGGTYDGEESRGDWGATTEVKLRAAGPVSTSTSRVKGAANFQDDSDLFASLSDKQNRRSSSVGTGANVTDIATPGTSGKETQSYDDHKSLQSSQDNLTKNRSNPKVELAAHGSESRRVQNETGLVDGRVGKQDGGVRDQKVFKVKATENGSRCDEPSSTRAQRRDSTAEAPARRHHHLGNYAMAVPSPDDPWTNAMKGAAEARETIAHCFSAHVERQLEGFHSTHGEKIDLAAYGGQQMATAALDGGRSALFGLKAILDSITSDEVGSAANETFRKSMTFAKRVVDLVSSTSSANIQDASGDDANTAALPPKDGSDGGGALLAHHPDTTKRKLSKTVRSARSAIAAFGRAVEAAREMAERSASALSAVALLGAKQVASMEEAGGEVADDQKQGEERTLNSEESRGGRGRNGEEKFRKNSLNVLAKLRGARNGIGKRAVNGGGGTEREMKGGAGNSMYFATPVNKMDS